MRTGNAPFENLKKNIKFRSLPIICEKMVVIGPIVF